MAETYGGDRVVTRESIVVGSGFPRKSLDDAHSTLVQGAARIAVKDARSGCKESNMGFACGLEVSVPGDADDGRRYGADSY